MEIEKCVVCGDETPYNTNTHIDFRYGYVEGTGQLCKPCYNYTPKTDKICISTKVVYDTPNDAELGEKVRQLYWENQNK